MQGVVWVMASTFALPVPAGGAAPIHRVPAVVAAFVAAIVLVAAGVAAGLWLPASATAPVGSHTRLLASQPTTEAPR